MVTKASTKLILLEGSILSFLCPDNCKGKRATCKKWALKGAVVRIKTFHLQRKLDHLDDEHIVFSVWTMGIIPLLLTCSICSLSFPNLPLALHWQSVSFVTKQFQKCFRNTEDCANGSHRSAHHGCLLGCHWAGFCDGLEVLGHRGSFTKALSSKHQEIKARQTSKRHLSQSKGWCKEAPCTESCLF